MNRALYELVVILVMISELLAAVYALAADFITTCGIAGIVLGAYLALMWPFWRKVYEGKIKEVKLKYLVENLAAVAAALIVVEQFLASVVLTSCVAAFISGFFIAFAAKNVVHEVWKSVLAKAEEQASA